MSDEIKDINGDVRQDHKHSYSHMGYDNADIWETEEWCDNAECFGEDDIRVLAPDTTSDDISEQAAINCAIRRMKFSVTRWDTDEGYGLGDVSVEVTGDDFYRNRKTVMEISLAEVQAEQIKLDAADEIEVTDEMVEAMLDNDSGIYYAYEMGQDKKPILRRMLKAAIAARKK